MVEEFQRRRDMIVPGLNAIDGVSCTNPGGAFYVFPNVKKFGISSKALAEGLLNEAGVAVLDGASFGDCGEGHLRLSFAN